MKFQITQEMWKAIVVQEGDQSVMADEESEPLKGLCVKFEVGTLGVEDTCTDAKLRPLQEELRGSREKEMMLLMEIEALRAKSQEAEGEINVAESKRHLKAEAEVQARARVR